MIIQDFLKTHSLKDLEAEGIDYSIFDNGKLLQLNYNQISSKESSKMACECRSLILGGNFNETDIVGETKVVCRSFNRFFNLGQAGATIDFSKPLTIWEKLDGSLINIYYYDGEWRTSSRSVWNGENIINNTMSMRKLVELALKDIGKSFEILTSRMEKRYVYIFELTTPVNQIVVSHDKFSLTLIGIREIETGQEKNILYFENLGMPFPKIYNFHSLSEINDFIEKLPDHNAEGFVVCDKDFNRVKIKSPKYLLAHKIATKNMSDPNLLEAILLGMDDDMIPFMNKYFADRLMEIKEKLSLYLIKSDSVFNSHRDLDRKSFAIAIQKCGVLTQYLFEMYQGKSKSTLESIRNKKTNVGFVQSLLNGLLKQTSSPD